MSVRWGLVGAIALGMAAPASAQVFSSRVDVDGNVQNFEFDTAEEILTSFTEDTLRDQFPTYQDSISAVDGSLDYRGLRMRVTIGANSPDIRLQIRSINIDETFDEFGTREQNAEAFEDFLTSDGGSILARIQAELARVSPVDPVAGNPNSIQSTMVDTLFSNGAFNTGVPLSSFSVPTDQSTQLRFKGSETGKMIYTRSAAANANSFELGVRGGSFSAGEAGGTALSLPLGYTLRADARPGLRFNFSIPISYSDTDGAVTIGGIGGFGIAFPLSDVWSITPAVTYGVVGSIDLGAAAQLAGASVTSSYTIRTDPVNYTIGNMLGYVTTLPFNYDDISYDPGINNTVLKNGVSAEVPASFTFFGRTTSYQAAYAYTYLLGTELFMNDYHDVSVSWGVADGNRGLLSVVRIGVGATLGRDFTNFGLNFGYTF
ncbi:MAG: hypothetical protein AAFQ36_09815 [Pseudomonadota bacterium]